MSPSQLNTTNVDHPNSCEEESKVMLRKWAEIKGVQIPLYTLLMKLSADTDSNTDTIHDSVTQSFDKSDIDKY